MAATAIVLGVLREVWQETVAQGSGPPATVTTHIRCELRSLSKVRAQLVIDEITGAPAPFVTTQVSATGFLEFLVFTGGLGATMKWTLDAQLTHSIQQANDRDHGAYVSIVNSAAVGGGIASQTLAQTYAIGTVQADQTMVIDTVNHGAGVIINAAGSGVTADGPALEIQQSDAWDTTLQVSRRGAIVNGPVLEFERARGDYGIPTAVQLNDLIGVIDFQGYYDAAFYPFARIQVVCLSDESFGTALDFLIATDHGASVDRLWRMTGTLAGASSFICYGATPYVVPATTNVGYLGTGGQYWAGISAGIEDLYHASDDSLSSYLAFHKWRGTTSVPANILAGDDLGALDFYGYPAGAPTLDARIVATCVTAAPTYGTGIEFYIKPRSGVLSTAMVLNGDGIGANTTLILSNAPDVIPDVDGTGQLGIVGNQWDAAHIDGIYVHENLSVGATAFAGGADHTILYTSTGCVVPAPQAASVYQGAELFTLGSNQAAVSISAHEPAVAVTAETADTLIPIIYNGTEYYLLAYTVPPA